MTYNDDAEYKFSSEGEVLRFQGNTVICFINETDGQIYDDLVWAQKLLKSLSFSAKYAYVPATSFHMTVIPLIDQTHRNTPFWPELFEADCELQLIDQHFKKLVDPIPKPSPIRMVIDSTSSYRINLFPDDEQTEKSLSRYRKDIATVTGLRFPNHDAYTFHITLAYQLKDLIPDETQEQQQVLEKIDNRLKNNTDQLLLGPPEFVIFNDMYAFYKDLVKRDKPK